MNAFIEFPRDCGMTLRTCFGNIKLVDFRFRVVALSHLMTAMAVDTIGSLGISRLQGRSVYTVFIRGDKPGGGSNAGSHTFIVQMTGEAEFLLRDFSKMQS